MSEGLSKITGPIPPDPTLCPDYYRRPLSALGRLEGNALKLDLLSGPIPPEPSLYPGSYSVRHSLPPPRIKPDAKNILERGRTGTVGMLLQLDGISFFQELMPKRRERKDHEKENLKRMREIQRKCREKEQAQEQRQPKPVKALWKSQKYENVGSKVKAKLQENPSPPNPEAQNYLRAYSRCGTGIRPRGSPSPDPSQSGQIELVAAQDLNGSLKTQKNRKVDFVSHNALNAKRAPMQRSQSLQSLTKVLEQKQKELEEYNAKQKGHVPRYLIERKDHWRREAEERLRNMPSPDTPPGHTMMPESRRLETLQNLKKSQEKLLKDLLLLPVRVDTLSVQTRRLSLEKKLSEIEEALKIFSRPKVFIKLDS